MGWCNPLQQNLSPSWRMDSLFWRQRRPCPSNLDQPHPQLHLLSTPTKAHMITFCSVLEPDWIPIVLLQEGEICSLCYSQPAAYSVSCFPLANSGEEGHYLISSKVPRTVWGYLIPGKKMEVFCTFPHFPLYLHAHYCCTKLRAR